MMPRPPHADLRPCACDECRAAREDGRAATNVSRWIIISTALIWLLTLSAIFHFYA